MLLRLIVVVVVVVVQADEDHEAVIQPLHWSTRHIQLDVNVVLVDVVALLLDDIILWFLFMLSFATNRK